MNTPYFHFSFQDRRYEDHNFSINIKNIFFISFWLQRWLEANDIVGNLRKVDEKDLITLQTISITIHPKRKMIARQESTIKYWLKKKKDCYYTSFATEIIWLCNTVTKNYTYSKWMKWQWPRSMTSYPLV